MLLPLILSFLMLAVLYYDLTRYLIPNWIVGMVVLAYPVGVWLAPHAVDWQGAALLALGTFAAGFVIYILRLMGGGDVKLLAACALWVGLDGMFDYLGAVALIGGALALALWLARILIGKFPALGPAPEKTPRLLKPGAPVPYGLAIAGVFLYRIWTSQIPALVLG